MADTAYDADHLRQAIAAKGALAVIPNNPSWFGSGPWFRASEGTVRMQRYAWSIDKWWEVKRNGPSRGKLRPSVVDRSYRCRTLGRHRPISHNIRAKFQAETVPICQDGSVGFLNFCWVAGTKNNVHFVTYWPERIRCSRVMMSGAGRDSWRASWKNFISALR